MSNKVDVNTWTPEQRTWFRDMWKAALEQSDGRVPDGVEGNQLEAAYQLNLLPRPHEQPISTPKHDGNLDEYSDDRHVMVELEPKGTPRGMFGFPSDVPMVHVDGGYGGIEMEDIILDPKQALSLLAWLEQEKEKLELLAMEQNDV